MTVVAGARVDGARGDVKDVLRSQLADQRQTESREPRFCFRAAFVRQGPRCCSTDAARSGGAVRRERPARGSLRHNFRGCSWPRGVVTTYAAINTSKHARTRGIERFDNAEVVWTGHHRALRVVDRHGKRKPLHPGEWHLTEADAVRNANELRARAIRLHCPAQCAGFLSADSKRSTCERNCSGSSAAPLKSATTRSRTACATSGFGGVQSART